MKKLIYLLLTSLSALADPVSFAWSPVPEADEYRLYTTSGTFETTDTRITVDIPPDAQAYLVAVNGIGESDPTPSLVYHPVIVDLVLEHSRNLPEFFEFTRWELFRLPDVLFDPASLNVKQVLEAVPGRVAVYTPLMSVKIGVTSDSGRKFFRSYVAVRP
jgi:hypothetical protein